MTGPSLWVGIDPGARSTGIICRRGRTLVLHEVVERGADETEIGPGPIYLASVCDTVARLFCDVGVSLMRLTGQSGFPRVAVEGVRRPNPHVNRRNGKATTDPTAIIGTAMVLGAILNGSPDAVIVPPGDNGSGILASYPAGLVTDAERRQGLNRPAGQSATIRHCRSAWDVSIRAEQMMRLGGAA